MVNVGIVIVICDSYMCCDSIFGLSFCVVKKMRGAVKYKIICSFFFLFLAIQFELNRNWNGNR